MVHCVGESQALVQCNPKLVEHNRRHGWETIHTIEISHRKRAPYASPIVSNRPLAPFVSDENDDEDFVDDAAGNSAFDGNDDDSRDNDSRFPHLFGDDEDDEIQRVKSPPRRSKKAGTGIVGPIPSAQSSRGCGDHTERTNPSRASRSRDCATRFNSLTRAGQMPSPTPSDYAMEYGEFDVEAETNVHPVTMSSPARVGAHSYCRRPTIRKGIPASAKPQARTRTDQGAKNTAQRRRVAFPLSPTPARFQPKKIHAQR